MDVRFSITLRQHKSLHNVIEAIPEDAWTPIPYWMDGAADVAETTYIPFHRPDSQQFAGPVIADGLRDLVARPVLVVAITGEAHNLARWTARMPGSADRDHQDPDDGSSP